jgi:hypothetical protein
MDSVAQQIREHLEKTYAWVNGGELERMIFLTLKGKPAKPSNISKRLRELSAEKIIDKDLRDGSIWYHGKNKITLPAPFPVKKENKLF